eukprot:CAMPEP_0113592822 /NCGR_PEP_ID=MMETSP0015_2-20120614/38063_1 /TAXON_ID=2838 /ORGANISM="Odontella" /LENGTH=166 /DNA_ID=CAMNT_0000499407 /DNA_START=536 /DNA_END=1032 /DNA_ORIENTATION=+ /assembly_acc=CAM_ASM_000160
MTEHSAKTSRCDGLAGPEGRALGASGWEAEGASAATAAVPPVPTSTFAPLDRTLAAAANPALIAAADLVGSADTDASPADDEENTPRSISRALSAAEVRLTPTLPAAGGGRLRPSTSVLRLRRRRRASSRVDSPSVLTAPQIPPPDAEDVAAAPSAAAIPFEFEAA